MVFRTTSTKSRRNAGIGLVEMMVSVAIGSMLLTALAAVTFYTARSFAALSNYVDLDQSSRNALDHMSQEIRQSDRLTSFTTNRLDFLYNGSTLTYTYNPTAKTLTRSYNGESRVLLSECETLTFGVFQRNPVGGSYNSYPTGSAATAKLIQLTWVCSRQILGQSVNTESVQSAKIVLRKQE